MSALPIRGYSPNLQDYIDDPDKFNNPMQGTLNRPQILDDIKRQPDPTEMPMPPAPRLPQVYELPSDAKDLQRLREEYDRLSNIRFAQDPGPEFGAKLQALAGQISQLDPEFKNPYAIGGDLGVGPRRPDEGLDLAKILGLGGNPDEVYSIGVGERVPGTSDGLPGPPQTPAPQAPTPPATQAPDTQQFSSDPKIAKLQKYFLDRGLGIPPRAESSFEEKEDYKEYLIDMKKDVRSNFGDPTNPALGYKPEEAAYLAENQPKYREFNERLKESQRMAREPNKYADRFFRPTSNLGTPDSLIPSNIVGQSFDPGFAARYLAGGTGETNVDAGNGIGMMVMPQRPEPPAGSVFGGYGQQAPMQALAPYAGMAQSQPMPTDFFPSYVPRPDPIYETVPRPETDQPATQPNAQPVMGGGG